ncbi:hypothetical protein Tco_1581363, partial [Tanacetum coccineum]
MIIQREDPKKKLTMHTEDIEEEDIEEEDIEETTT